MVDPRLRWAVFKGDGELSLVIHSPTTKRQVTLEFGEVITEVIRIDEYMRRSSAFASNLELSFGRVHAEMLLDDLLAWLKGGKDDV